MGPMNPKSRGDGHQELDPGLARLSALVHQDSENSSVGQERVARVRARLNRHGKTTFGRRAMGWLRIRPGWLAGGTALAGATVALFVLFWSPPKESALSVSLHADSARLVGAWVASQDETKQLHFSDGTQVALSPRTSVRVRETTPRGGTIELGQGRALATIRPLPEARWTFLAGPFSVRVTGTAFDLAWDPGTQTLELALHEGSVDLSGPTLETRRQVSQGQFVRIALGSQSSSPDAATSRSTDSPAVEPSPSPDPSPFPTDDSDSTAERAPHPSNATKSAQALWDQAQEARLAGDAHRAKVALLALRRQHGKRGQTAFLLGKIHADQLGNQGEAVRWFETYLKEAPGGSLSEQALGRLVELRGASPAGQDHARAYLRRYPNGSYADVARRALR